MKKKKYLFFSAALLALTQSVAQNPVNDNPAYSIVGKDSTCQVFIYSPAENQGLHLAYFTDDERWIDVGQLCASDFGPWGSEKKMYRPFVMKAMMEPGVHFGASIAVRLNLLWHIRKIWLLGVHRIILS